ncbi:unnamed protein product [Effrenium voratum]|nr:unnamed protein product [Effrenium voratum]
MQIPADFRCCVCLAVPERPIKSNCAHRLCQDCASKGNLQRCPVCESSLGREIDTAFAAEAAEKTLRCKGCDEEVRLADADSHECGRLRKSPRLEGPKSGPTSPNRSTFKCPWCEEANLSSQSLLEHCKAKHTDGSAAVCPICAAMPWGDPNYVSRDFLSHLELRHRCDYSVLTDFEADEEAMLRRALEESCKDGPVDFEAELQRALEESARDMEAFS